MALQTQMVCSLSSNVEHRVLLFSPSLRIRSEKASVSEDSTPVPKGKGFGSGSGSGSSKRKEKGGSRKRERASIIRRSPVEKPPAFVSEKQQQEQEEGKEQDKNESAFILAWLGFGAIILVEGISLAASGFLPQEWDKLFVKYLYPSFTPTVFLFVAGAVAYGVFKYQQNENITQRK